MMSSLDAAVLRRSLTDRATADLDKLEVFDSVPSTNSHLLEQPAPAAGRFRIAIADHQTAGRGRHHRRWVSPAGAGLFLSMAYTFARPPEHLPGLTLAIGVCIVRAMQELSIDGVSLKWPNDIVALDGKLGGVLTEVKSGTGDGVSVVTGVGINLDLPGDIDLGDEPDWAHRAVDLKSVQPDHPQRETITVAVIEALYGAMMVYGAQGFTGFSDTWHEHDWLRGRDVTVDMPGRQITGTAAGVDFDGALLVDTGHDRARVISGSIVMAGVTEHAR